MISMKNILVVVSLLLCIATTSIASDNESDTTCYEQIDSLLSYNDKITVTVSDGTEFTGALKKVTPDSIMIRYKPIKFVQSAVSQIIMIDNISKIEFNGLRQKNYFLPEGYNRALSFGAGILISTQVVGRSDDDGKSKINNIAIGVGLGLLIGEFVNQLTTKKFPVDINIQCR